MPTSRSNTTAADATSNNSFPAFCLPVQKKSIAEALAYITKYEREYGYIEVWLDLIEGLTTADVQRLITTYSDRLILLFRRPELAPIKMSLAMRKEIIGLLDGTPVLLDLDSNTQEDDFAILTEGNASIELICSYHNYRETPTKKTLENVYDAMKVREPAIVKFSTFCKSQKDVLRLLEFTLKLKSDGRRFVVLGMGDEGKVTRIVNTMWGNEMTFAPPEASQSSAPGQLTRAELSEIINLLKK